MMNNDNANDFHTAMAHLRIAIAYAEAQREADYAEARAYADRINKRYGVR